MVQGQSAASARCNLGAIERSLSALAGGVLLGLVARRCSKSELGLLAGASALFVRASTGFCPVRQMLERMKKTPLGMVPPEILLDYPRLEVSKQGTLKMLDEPSDSEEPGTVTEASMESFPASDPPSWVV